VLVIDDLDDMRTLIHRALSDHGYQVDVAANLAEARQQDPRGYDAVLVDARLGPERGLDLVEALRAADPAAASQCLVLTGGATDAIPDGVARLTKPFKLEDLLAAVQALHRPTAGQAAQAEPGASLAPDDGVHPQWPARSNGRQRPAVAPSAWQLLGLVRRLRARERHELVDFLHDGPIQELTAVALGLQMAAQATPAAPRFEAARQQLDMTARSLRWLVDGNWPFVQPETSLADALRQRTAWLLAAPAAVHAEIRAADMTATGIPVIVDVAELMLLAVLPAGPPMRAQIVVRTGAAEIGIELTLSCARAGERPAGDPAAARAALDELASALGVTAQATLDDQRWQVRIVLPRDELASALGATAQATLDDQRWQARIVLPRQAQDDPLKKEMI
jgi:DNA-binding response OmpR family regulator